VKEAQANSFDHIFRKSSTKANILLGSQKINDINTVKKTTI
jgi:hypothetical protein